MADQSLSQADHDRIIAAVVRAESTTSGEIATIIADQSDAYADVTLWWAALAAYAGLACCALFPANFMGWAQRLTNSWGEPDESYLLYGALALVTATFVCVWLLLHWQQLRLLLTPKQVKRHRVRARALFGFETSVARRTARHTGVLIYLSLAERRAEIVADAAIHAKVGEAAWGDAMIKLTDQAKAGRVADGMIAAIEDVGAILSTHFPRAADDRNELSDRAIEI